MKPSYAFAPRRALHGRLRPTLFALAVLGASLVGLGAQSLLSELPATSEPNTKMQHFVIIFRQGPRTLTDADLARRQKEVSAWAREHNAAGHKLEPRILAPDVLRHGASASADTWPITALLFLEARDLTEAAKVAQSHPANHFGASVEVRPWAPPAVPTPVTPAPSR